MRSLRCFWSSDPWLRGRPPDRPRVALALIWLGFLLVPLVTAITNKGPGHGWTIAAAAVFTGTYMGLVLVMFRAEHQRLQWALAGVLVTVAVGLTVADRSGWGFLFTYCAACAALVAPARLGFAAIFACSALAVGCSLLGGASSGAAVGYGASAIGVGLLMVLMRDLRMRNQELTEARAELARTAVVRERERFARDLHDLLGHTLSVIALKAELAGRLLRERPGEAAAEVAEVEAVARQALGEVRHAVSGYRRPTLEGELAGARMALSAAGIEAQVDFSPVSFDPEVEAVLAWAVREGATNVIRHSGARHCCVKVSARLGGAEVEVLDDGARARPVDGEMAAADWAVNGDGGHGLAGLRERAEALRGRIEAGGRPEGGFRLAVSVPVTAGP
jgi:two-component system, NarL family, sensor histidine kinase DesK